MGCIQTIARVVLIITNIVFFLFGFCFVILGFVLRFGQSLYEPYLESGLEKLQTTLGDTNLASFDVDSINLGEVMVGMSLGLILGGLVLCGLTLFGCCGAWYKMKLFLFIYAIVILAFVLLEIITIAVLYGKPDVVKDPIKSSMTDYKGLASSEAYSLGWNVMMMQYACCGVDDYQDFNVSNQWANAISGVTLDTPVACCTTLPTGSNPSDFLCATSFNETLSNGLNGCYDALWDLSFGNEALIVPILVICGIIQVLFIIFAFLLTKEEKEKKVAPS